MDSFDANRGSRIAAALVRTIRENRDSLSEIDGLIGDGDHGVNMNKGFAKFAEAAGDQEMDVSEAFKRLGRTLLGDIGGSMGPLYGSFFIEMSKKAKGLEAIDANAFDEMLTAALYKIKEIGGAVPGDKTMVDCLEPAVLAYHAALGQGAGFAEALCAMKDAAIKGRDATVDMTAKLGRASRLGERSRGVPDAGATSCCLILCAMAEEIIKQ